VTRCGWGLGDPRMREWLEWGEGRGTDEFLADHAAHGYT